MAKIVSPLTGTLKSIKSQFISKEKLLKSSLKVQQKRSEDKRKNSERERFINYEKVLERPLAVLGKPIKSITKRLGFLDALKNFIVNVLLGFFALRLLKYLPQLKEVFITILKAGNFIIEISGKILDGLVTFVDRGYAAYDHARKIVGKIGGEAAIESMDKLSSQMNSVMNSIFIAGMLFSDFGGVGQGGGVAKKAIDASVDTVKNVLTEQAGQQVAKQAARAAVGPLGAAGIVLGTGLLASAIGEGAYQVKKLGTGLQGWLSGKMNESSQDKNPLTRFLKKGFYGWLSTSLGPAIWILNGTGVLFDIVGAPFRYGVELIRAAFMKLNDDAKGLAQQRKNLGKFDARIRDGIRENFSILSPLFKFMGMKGVSQKLETPGSFGSLYGEQAVKDMGYYGGGKVKVGKYASGGPVSIQRTEVKDVDIPRTDVSRFSPLSIGSLVGGVDAFSKVFPYVDDKSRMNRYSYMKDSHQTIQSIPNVGAILSLASKSLLGDKVTGDDYDSAANELSSFMFKGLSETDPTIAQSLFSVMDTMIFTKFMSLFLMKSMKEQISGIVNLLRVQVGLAPVPGDPSNSEADPCATACDTGPSAAGAAVYGDATDKAILDLISSVEAQSYDTMNVSRGATPGKPTQMTVDWLEANARGAIGRYQHMPGYFKERVIAAGFKGSDRFTPEVQDRTTLHFLYTSHSYRQWRNGQISDEAFGNKLSATWRGLPHSSGGTYPDEHAGRNKAHMSRPAFMTRLAQIRAGAGTGSASMAKIAPGSPAANVDSCICDPSVPDGDPGQIGGDPGPGGGTLRFGRTGSMSVAAGWAHAHFDTVNGTPQNVIINDTVPLLKKMASSGLKPELFDTTPILAGKDNNYYIDLIKKGITLHTHRPGPRFDVNMPGFPLVPFPLKDVRYTPNEGQGVNALVPGSGKTALFHLGNNPTTGKYSSSRQSGGPTFTGGIRLLHQGEYVIDKDSVDLFGGVSFYHMINGVENKKQRAQKSSSLIQHLSKYTGRKIDQRPTIIVESPEDIIVSSPPIYVPSGSGGSGSSGGESDWEYDNLELR